MRPSGRCPYEDLKAQVGRTGDPKQLAKILALVETLKEGYRLKMTKLTTQLEGDLWELRPGNYRVLYYWDDVERSFVLLNGFRKQSNRTPRREIDAGNRLIEEHRSMSVGRRPQ